jgi:branched-chain amino acid transport system permease protein
MRDTLLFGVFALSLDLIWGRMGLLSFGQAIFFGLGGYTLGILATHSGEASYLELLAAIAVPAAFALIAGYFLIFGRVRGAYFAIVTLALSLVLMQLAISWRSVTGGDQGILGVPQLTLPLPGFTLEFTSSMSLYYAALVAAVVTFAITRFLASGQFGLVLSAIRDDEDRARFFGYNTSVYIVLALAVSGAIAGLAGALYTAATTYIAPDLLGPVLSTEVVVWVAVGGRGSLLGAFLGTLIVRLLEEVVSSQLIGSWPFFIGVFFLLMVFVFPRGIAHVLDGLLRLLAGRAARLSPRGAPVHE